MTRVIDISAADPMLSSLLDEVRAGNRIVLAKDGVACARGVPIESVRAERKPGRLKGKLGPKFFDPLSADEIGPV